MEPIRHAHATVVRPEQIPPHEPGAWGLRGHVDRQQETRPHARAALDQYLLFPDEFSERTWAVLHLHYGEGLSRAQIAQLLGMHAGSVSRIVSNARQRKNLLLFELRLESQRRRESR